MIKKKWETFQPANSEYSYFVPRANTSCISQILEAVRNREVVVLQGARSGKSTLLRTELPTLLEAEGHSTFL
jgi:hypothetical protein